MSISRILVILLIIAELASSTPQRKGNQSATTRRPFLSRIPDPIEEEPSPYIVTPGQHWALNVWKWLKVTPQHAIYIREPHLPWYGNLIKWLRINVLFRPVF